jgi:(p)ppGpp synthase/HD superfamily hydrolase
MAVAVRDPAGDRANAIAFLLDAYEGVPTEPGKGLPHAQAVADVLREFGFDAGVQLVALLHDVLEDTDRSVADVQLHFGDSVAERVAELTEDDSIRSYGPRKRALREQLQAAGSPVLDIAVADKIASLSHALITGTRIRARKLDHYRAVLHLGRDGGVADAMCRDAERLLDAVEERFPRRRRSNGAATTGQ